MRSSEINSLNPMSEASFYDEDVAIDFVRRVHKQINEDTGLQVPDVIEVVMQLRGAIDTIKDLKSRLQ